ncbi:hypothetical protein KNJ79_09015 [Sphingopyxis indica]|uniref:cytochrome c3 family protein n=1 Tax=Sphingopyxis indica TaxID=436663 RepID=UPI0029393567|nr:cytochrome c3 family protein [Sphingopyxis indica]WOF44994.1 hypothetical protein KNJ79_09015 [Sphingopyxis indica]
MVSPGNLRPEHAALEDDCFACHVPFRAVSAERCIACHKVADIGKRTTRGLPIGNDRLIPPFHQALTEKNCLACHSDHPAPRLTAESPKSFDHALLTPVMRGQCQACHRAPQDMLHQGFNLPCAQCHQSTGWEPATFDHSRYFLLDDDHRVACVTCHTGQNYRRYTCYGCHEHASARIRAEHEEEGIRNLDNCVRCHRSPHGEPNKGERREGRGRERDD